MSFTAIDDLCDARDMTLPELAATTGVPLAEIQAYAAGKGVLSNEQKAEIAVAFNVLMDHLEGPMRFDPIDGTKEEICIEIQTCLGPQTGCVRLIMPDGSVHWHPVASGALMDIDAVGGEDVYSLFTLDDRVLVVRSKDVKVRYFPDHRLPVEARPPAGFPIHLADRIEDALGRAEALQLTPRLEGRLRQIIESVPKGIDPWKAFLKTRIHMKDGTIHEIDLDLRSLYEVVQAADGYAIDQRLVLRTLEGGVPLILPGDQVVLVDAPLHDYIKVWMAAVALR